MEYSAYICVCFAVYSILLDTLIYCVADVKNDEKARVKMQIRFWVLVDTDGDELGTYGSANSDYAWLRFNDVDTEVGTRLVALGTDAETIVTEFEVTNSGIVMLQAFGIQPVS